MIREKLPDIDSLMTEDESSALSKWAEFAAMSACTGETALACEIGSYEGYSTAILAEYMPVWSIDLGGDLMTGDAHPETIGTEIRTSFIQNMVVLGLTPSRVFSVCGTSDCLRTLPAAIFDFIVIDADHSYEWCMRDLRNAARSLKSKGILAIHDYQIGRETGPGFGVTQAVDDFMITDPKWKQIDLVGTLMFIGSGQHYRGVTCE